MTTFSRTKQLLRILITPIWNEEVRQLVQSKLKPLLTKPFRSPGLTPSPKIPALCLNRCTLKFYLPYPSINCEILPPPRNTVNGGMIEPRTEPLT